MSPPDKKRQRTDNYSFHHNDDIAVDVRSRRSAFLASLNRGVSPPAGRESPTLLDKVEVQTQSELNSEIETMANLATKVRAQSTTAQSLGPRIIPSPFKLTRIRDLPAHANLDTVSIRDILGNVMLKEVWLFDFLYDVDWVM
jgi:tyrosyl-DNA phosphodiesterase 1